MVTDIDALNERLKDPNETFTADEVQSLIDWNVQNAMHDEYEKTLIANALQESLARREIVQTAMTKLLNLWDGTPTVPALVEVTNE